MVNRHRICCVFAFQCAFTRCAYVYCILAWVLIFPYMHLRTQPHVLTHHALCFWFVTTGHHQLPHNCVPLWCNMSKMCKNWLISLVAQTLYFSSVSCLKHSLPKLHLVIIKPLNTFRWLHKQDLDQHLCTDRLNRQITESN